MILLPTRELHAAFRDRYAPDAGRFAVEVCNQEPTHQQFQLYDAVSEAGCRVSAVSGHGCFGLGTPIMLASGEVRPVEAIAVGDRLMGGDGQIERTVLELYRGRERMYRFTYSDGGSHVFNESHILCLVNEAGFRGKQTVRQWLALPSLRRSRYQCYRWNQAAHRHEPRRIARVDPLGEGDYYGFELDGDHLFLGGDFTVLHNTGKTRAFGIIALWHLLCYFSNSNQGSETVISAPKVDQVRKGVWREAAVALNELQRGPHAWLRPYVVLNSQRIYIRDFKETWFVHAKTAPRGSPDNVSGSHADWLLILTDETAGIPDGVMSRFTGALTDKRNRIACASQGSRNSGFFWETHHKTSTKQGGAWKALHFDGENSPLVSRENLREKEDEYGGRDSVEYKVRVRGLFPVDSENYLLGRTEIERCYTFGRIIAASDNPGWLIGFDVAGGGWRNKSVLIIARVSGNEEFGPDARRMEIVKIIRRGGTDPIEMGGIALAEARNLANSAVLIDAVGQGWPVFKNMEEQGINIHPVMWGKPNFRKSYKDRFLNQRAQANAFAARAAREGRLSILTDECKTDLVLEASRIPRKFDGRGKQFIMSKEDMEKEGIPSPDLWDAISFLFLEWAHYTPSGEEIAGGTGAQIKRAVREAEDAFADVP